MKDELPPLSEDDLGSLAWLLARYIANDLDQYETVRLRVRDHDYDVRLGPAGTGTDAVQVWPRVAGAD